MSHNLDELIAFMNQWLQHFLTRAGDNPGFMIHGIWPVVVQRGSDDTASGGEREAGGSSCTIESMHKIIRYLLLCTATGSLQPTAMMLQPVARHHCYWHGQHGIARDKVTSSGGARAAPLQEKANPLFSDQVQQGSVDQSMSRRNWHKLPCTVMSKNLTSQVNTTY
jgi:hypothetical protein